MEIADILYAVAAVIVAITSLLSAIFGFLSGQRLKKVQKQTDGLTERLVSVNRKDAKAEGVLEGKAKKKRE